MDRTLCFLDWQARWWDDRKARPNPRNVPQLEEGVKAYAIKQSKIQQGLRDRFLTVWGTSLQEEEFQQEEANDRALREELGLEGRNDDDEEVEIFEDGDTWKDTGDAKGLDVIEEVDEVEAEEAECFGFA